MGIVIGSGGKTINELTKRTGVSIDILSDGHIIVYHYLEAQLEVVHSDITRLIENTNNKRKR